MNRALLVLSVAAALAGCAKRPTLSENASRVRLLTKAEPVSPDCHELGNVSTGNDWMRETGDVNTYQRNEAAAAGGNVVVLDVIEKEEGLFRGSGRAFRCSGEGAAPAPSGGGESI